MTVLVTYASRSGSTVGIAEAVSRTLVEYGVDVDIRPMRDVHDTTGYEAVVAGSAIRVDRWLPEAMDFMKKHQPDLQQKPVATFLVCMTLATDNEARYNRGLQTASKYMEPVRDLIQPVSEGLFAGVLDISKIQERHWQMLFRIPIMLGFFAEGDYRDWGKIRQWASTLPNQILKEQVA